MSESEDIDLEDLSTEAIEGLANKVSSELESRDKESVKASLGMFSMQINSHESLEDTVEAFEEVWTNRVEEIEESRANTLQESLEEDKVRGLFK